MDNSYVYFDLINIRDISSTRDILNFKDIEIRSKCSEEKFEYLVGHIKRYLHLFFGIYFNTDSSTNILNSTEDEMITKRISIDINRTLLLKEEDIQKIKNKINSRVLYIFYSGDLNNDDFLNISRKSNIEYIKLNRNEVSVCKNGSIITNRLANYLSNLNLNSNKIKNQIIYFTRHGQSEYNVENRIGGDSTMTELGIEYAHELSDYLTSTLKLKNKTLRDIEIWTSCLKRTQQVYRIIKNYHPDEELNHTSFINLNEINGGKCDNMTYGEIKKRYPGIHQKRSDDKLRYRYPEGESYLDVIDRLEDIINKINSSNNDILIISHNSILRILIGYYLDYDREVMPHESVDLNTLYILKNNYNKNKYMINKIKLKK